MRAAIVGGNWNNGLHVGSRYLNLNNAASNTNTNIGSRHSINNREIVSRLFVRDKPRLLAKIKLIRVRLVGLLSNSVKAIEREIVKRYGYLYKKICDVENIKAAIVSASRNKRNRRDVRYVLNHIDEKAEELSYLLRTHTYSLNPYTEGTVVGSTNNKTRNIHKPNFYPD